MTFIRMLNKLDTLILFFLACLITIGTVAIYDATSGTKLDGLHINNLMLFGSFCVPMLLIAFFDYRFLVSKLAYLLYGIGIVMLVLVKFKGESLNGSSRWLSIGSFQFQPSELAKLFTILLVAHMLHKRTGEKLRLFKDVLPVTVIVLVPFFLILKQPDLGTALVFVGILLGMLWMGNIRAIYMILLVGFVSVLIGLILWLYHADYELLTRFVQPHQLARIQTFLDPTSDPNKSWHVINAINAIGTGGLSGGSGYFSEHGFIPYVYSDSIYVIIGERYGFMGSAVLLMLYFLMIYRMIITIMESKRHAGCYVVVGIISMLVFQIFVNIGMHIGLLPLTGISLPFISYGGSSLLINMIAIGLVLSVKIHDDVEDNTGMT
ncbi:rod shape-determining protein RodA [Cohnella endophytica]|uniref:Rod shape-determining protein RodA n=1 Tax=Cohnella endophytica TaxID=2419778 RepID=A0A494XWQ9_9BACL|nr:FtsW/RodA/SpoVE family cell cycle protein [Cohnella endophytica]RKP55014.1 rod shape-determining protein RodA [Cohnella endophytica]